MATVNYWDDNWEEQLEEVQGKSPFEPESWEDIEVEELQVEEPTKPEIEVQVVESAWKKQDNNTPNADKDYKKDFPTLKEKKQVQKGKEEKERVQRLREKSKHNIYEAFNDDEAGRPSKPISRISKPLKGVRESTPRQHKEEKLRRRPPKKSRFCKDGANCQRGRDCWWAHSESELIPERCNRGLKCRCIMVDENKEIHNHPRSQRVCMYRHDETIGSYLKRIGQSAPIIVVPRKMSRQATEMANVSGGRIQVKIE